MKLGEWKIGHRIFAPRLIPTLLASFMLAVLLCLAVWQVQRAEWKAGLIAQWQEQTQKPMIDELPPADRSDDVIYRKARLIGKFQHEKSVELYPRMRDDKQGFELITPLKLLDGEVVLIDRGFVASESTGSIDEPIGSVFVEGELRPFPKRGWMQPENKPEKDQWYWLDPAAMAKAKDFAPAYPLELIAEGKPLNNAWPVPRPLEAPYTNNHLGYALTWFLLALALVVIYFISQSKKG